MIYSYNKTNEMHQFLIICFWNITLHVSDRFSVHHQESSTVHTAMVYVIQFEKLVHLAGFITRSCNISIVCETLNKSTFRIPHSSNFITIIIIYSSSVPFTPCGAQGIHEELASTAISSYPPDLIPWSSSVFYFILYCPSSRSLRSTSSSIPLRIPI